MSQLEWLLAFWYAGALFHFGYLTRVVVETNTSFRFTLTGMCGAFALAFFWPIMWFAIGVVSARRYLAQ